MISQIVYVLDMLIYIPKKKKIIPPQLGKKEED
jgi:hypothetical protein